MEEMASLWSHQESNDELKLKIHYTALELEAVKAKANEEMNKNTESVKQLLHLLKLVCNERDEARDQIQKLLNKITPSINKSIRDCFAIDQAHRHHQYPLIKPANANSSIAESNSLSDAYNHCSSPVNSLFDPVTSPELSNINTKTLIVQDYQMLPTSFHAMHSPPNMDHASLMMESMIKGKALPQKGNLLKAVIEARPLLQTLFASNPLPSWGKLSPPKFVCNGGQNQSTMMTKQSQQLSEMPYGSFSQMIGGGGGSILSFNDINSSNCQWRMAASCPTASNLGQVEKRQRFR
ncbi:hypothetical protein L1987_22273 [Smallanthus sonchifolius]|uniref:Uncharacterized protein n=1 Tax=Smallanthus sonchifolius TaxID=185202 RepID=A0ACB9IEZ4_9ASTR|nr:hypothetical protein L1987_22273 [Smallanthus sonchifolius]